MPAFTEERTTPEVRKKRNTYVRSGTCSFSVLFLRVTDEKLRLLTLLYFAKSTFVFDLIK